MGIRLIKIIFLPLLAFLLILPFYQKVLAVENSSRIIVTPPRKNGNGDYLAKIGEDNILSFGICGNIDNPAQLKITLSVVGSPDQNIELHDDYTKAREPEVSCNDTIAYGPAKSFIYKPISADKDKTKNFTITYKKADNSNFVDWQFPLLVVDEWPADATEPKNSWAPPDLTKFGNMLAINDIFGDKLKLRSEIEWDTPQGLIAKILTILLEIAAVLALLAFVWSGFQFVTSSGEPGQVEKAKKAMVGAFIGLLIIIFAYSIVRAVDIFSSPPKEDSFKEVNFD